MVMRKQKLALDLDLLAVCSVQCELQYSHALQTILRNRFEVNFLARGESVKSPDEVR